MTKIALITDTHYGIKNDSIPFLFNTKQFLDNVFFPEIDRLGIDTIIHLGDLFDRRKYINYHTLQRVKADFLGPIKARNIDFHFILGNHDIYYKNNLDVVSLYELGFNNQFKIYSFPTDVEIKGDKFLFIPWVLDENKEATYEAIKNSPAELVMGHLELAGFEMFRGVPNYHGENKEIYERFKLVCTGHYHHKSSDGNIHYLGAHGEFSWSDYADPRGFHIFDLDTYRLEYIQNPFCIFRKVFYDDQGRSQKETLAGATEDLKNSIVKVIIKQKTNNFTFDMFMNKIEQLGVINCQVVDDHLNQDIITVDEVDTSEDTLSSIKKVVSTSNVDSKIKEPLENLFMDLYHEALKLGVD